MSDYLTSVSGNWARMYKPGIVLLLLGVALSLGAPKVSALLHRGGAPHITVVAVRVAGLLVAAGGAALAILWEG